MNSIDATHDQQVSHDIYSHQYSKAHFSQSYTMVQYCSYLPTSQPSMDLFLSSLQELSSLFDSLASSLHAIFEVFHPALFSDKIKDHLTTSDGDKQHLIIHLLRWWLIIKLHLWWQESNLGDVLSWRHAQETDNEYKSFFCVCSFAKSWWSSRKRKRINSRKKGHEWGLLEAYKIQRCLSVMVDRAYCLLCFRSTRFQIKAKLAYLVLGFNSALNTSIIFFSEILLPFFITVVTRKCV